MRSSDSGQSNGTSGSPQTTLEQTEAKAQSEKNEKEKLQDYVKDLAGTLPDNPSELISDGWKDITQPEQAANSNSRTFENPKTGIQVRFDKGIPGQHGFGGKDHYHILNPNSTGKGDYYLDANGNPVPKNSSKSHIIPKRSK